jgi:hypothetical protein
MKKILATGCFILGILFIIGSSSVPHYTDTDMYKNSDSYSIPTNDQYYNYNYNYTPKSGTCPNGKCKVVEH